MDSTTNFPSRTTYWGRGASVGATLYFTGNIDGVSKYASIAANGLLGTWQSLSALPNPAGPRGRSLHQAFVYNGRLYIIGGWHGDGLPAYADAYYAPIQGGGSLGSFIQTTSLPTGVASHSATVSPEGMLYVVNDSNLFTAQIAGDGTIGSWTTEPPIPGLRHNNGGNTAVALASNLLVIVDYTNTFVCRLSVSGHLASVISTITNPAYFYQRSAYASNGKVYVTATSGRVYRIDDLPFDRVPYLSIRVLQVELCWDSTPTDIYQVQYRSTLTTNQWVNLDGAIAGDGSRQCITDSVSPVDLQRFYRLVITP